MTTEEETERERAWRLYSNDALEVLEPKDAAMQHCRQPMCHAPIWWGTTRANRKRCPFDIKPDGTRTATSHWRTCRQRPERASK